MELEAFRKEALAQGYDEVVVREWGPAKVTPSHTHPFAVRARIVTGEMWLTVGDNVRHFRPGEEFTLEREVAHSERYGEQGATLWAARRHKDGAGDRSAGR